MSNLTNQTTKVACIIGNPISHSLSPRIHNYWIKKNKLNAFYIPFQVHPKNLKTAIEGLRALNIAGSNITIPYKEKTISLVDEVDDYSLKIGAINTIINKKGKLIGTNTDPVGFLNGLIEAKFNWEKNKPVLVIGAGGAARAVLAALEKENVTEIRITNRTTERAKILSKTFKNISIGSWGDKALMKDIGLLINTTSLGMINKPKLDLNYEFFSKETIVYDLVYNPIKTPLILKTESLGARTISGLNMLFYQAKPGFSQWFGVNPKIDKEFKQHVISGIN